MQWIHFYCLILLLTDVASAAQVIELADGESAPVQVSRRDLTRIAMADGGRVIRLWGRSSQVSVEADPEAGQVFVRPLLVDDTAFALHVRDERGATYTLLAVPKDIPADTIFIRSRAASVPKAGSSPPRSHEHIALLKQWVRALVLDGAPPGTEVERMDRLVPLWQEAELRLVRRVSQPGLIADHYVLRNISPEQMRLQERELAALSEKIQAVVVELHVLAPGESTRVYVLRADE